MCPFITEIRCAPEVTSFFEELSYSEQTEWVEELLARTTYEKGNVSVCLFDTGITSGHPLLTPATDINHIQAVNTAWGSGDHQGHGTEMAGVALFFDLKQALESSNPISISHEIESVKILEGSRDAEWCVWLEKVGKELVPVGGRVAEVAKVHLVATTALVCPSPVAVVDLIENVHHVVVVLLVGVRAKGVVEVDHLAWHLLLATEAKSCPVTAPIPTTIPSLIAHHQAGIT